MKRSGSALRIRLCALVLLLCCVIGGVGLIVTGAQAVQEGNKLERAAGQAQIIYGVVCIVSGVIVRELINGFSTIVAAHESEENMAPGVSGKGRRSGSGSWTCASCKTVNSASRATCESCGSDKPRRCPACGTEFANNVSVCPRCGQHW